MVTLTRSEAKAAFNHVLDTVLGRDNTSSLKLSLLHEGIDDMFDFITLTESSINSLVYEDPNKAGSFLPVLKWDKMLVKCFLSFDQHLVSQSTPIDYFKLTHKNLTAIGSVQRIESLSSPRIYSYSRNFFIVNFIGCITCIISLTSCNMPSCHQERSITLSYIER
jgi:hypothetical protein